MINTEITYASTIMKITCPNCGATGKVKAKVPPKKDFVVLCPHCKKRFLVKVNVREFYRKEAGIPVHCFLPSTDMADMKDIGEGTITDISMGGMSVKVCEIASPLDDFAGGTILTFLFSLPPRDERVKVSGEIIRFSKEENKDCYNIAVKFSSLDTFAQRQIGFFLLP